MEGKKCSNSTFKQNKLWTFQRIMIILNHTKIKLDVIMGNTDILLILAV
jgi:hypothetical protein